MAKYLVDHYVPLWLIVFTQANERESSMLTHTRKDTIAFDLTKMASRDNGYDKSLPHRYATEVVFSNGTKGDIKLPLGILISLAAIFEVMRCEGSPGPALDKLYEALRKEHGNDAVSQAIDMGE